MGMKIFLFANPYPVRPLINSFTDIKAMAYKLIQERGKHIPNKALPN